MRSFSHTPIALQVMARNALLFFFLPCALMIQIGRDLSGWWVGAILLFAGVTQIALLLSAGGHRRFLVTAQQLHARLPWFRAEAFTWLGADQLPRLRDELTNTTMQVHEIDASSIRTADELATAIEQRFGARTFPADPVAKIVAILTKLGEKKRDAHAIVLLGADTFATHDAESLTRLVQNWTSTMHTITPHVLVFFVHTAPVAATPEPTATQMPNVKSEDWWQRRPGELVQP